MKTSRSMACVTVGYRDLLLSADDGLKLVKLLQGAVICERKYVAGSADSVYQVSSDPLNVELALVKPDQVRMPEGMQPEPARRAPRRVGLSQPLLERPR
jgi:hypothetical protein